MDSFLSCDWGTSSFRLVWVTAAEPRVLSRADSEEGILKTFTAWKQQPLEHRLHFFLEVIRRHVSRIEEKTQSSLHGVPLLISGMASSSIGMMELPYGELPFAVNGMGISTARLDNLEDWPHPTMLISGVKWAADVMRGEETELIGCIPDGGDPALQSIYIFPGTHSKHITVLGANAVGFTTYMTGEFFDLLSTKSVLQVAVDRGNTACEGEMKASFIEGVKDSMKEDSLLSTSFKVRTNGLFERYTRKENSTYLSGLLIGTELKSLTNARADRVYLCSGKKLKEYYETAFETLKLSHKVHTFPPEWVDEAVVRGHHKIFRKQLYD